METVLVTYCKEKTGFFKSSWVLLTMSIVCCRFPIINRASAISPNLYDNFLCNFPKMSCHCSTFNKLLRLW